VSPGIQDDSLLKGSAGSGQNNAAVFSTSFEPGNAAVDIQGPEVKVLKPGREILSPLKTKTALADAEVNHDIVKDSRPNDAVLTG